MRPIGDSGAFSSSSPAEMKKDDRTLKWMEEKDASLLFLLSVGRRYYDDSLTRSTNKPETPVL
jgi:hypothetical protein